MEPESPVQRSRSGIDAGLLATAIVAVSFAAILARWTEASALVLAFWRTFGGGLLLAPRARLGRPGSWAASRAEAGWILVGGAALALHFWSWLESLNRTSVAVSVTLVTTTPFFVAAVEWARGRRLAWQSQAALVVAMAGVVTLAASSSGTEAPSGLTGSHSSGVILALVGAIAMAVYLLAGSRLRATMSASNSAAPTFLTAGIGLGLAALVTGVNVFDLRSLDWLIVAAMILGPQLGGHAVLSHLLGRLDTMTISLALLAEPVVSTALAWILLSERPTSTALIGALIVVTGLALRTLDPRIGARS